MKTFRMCGDRLVTDLRILIVLSLTQLVKPDFRLTDYDFGTLSVYPIENVDVKI